MNSSEIIQKFNLHYDNILSAAAPGINEYEMSLFLTQAHLEIVSNFFTGTSQGRSLDVTEFEKSLFSRYILKATLDSSITQPLDVILAKEYTVPLIEECIFILNEKCIANNSFVLVKPVSLDTEYI